MGPVRPLSLIIGPNEVIVLYWAMLPIFCRSCILGRVPCTKDVKSWVPERGYGGVVSGYPTSTSLPRVDGLSMDPRVLGRHIPSCPNKILKLLNI